MGYQDHLRSSAEKPPCWGNERAFDPEGDDECRGCRFQHSCRSEIMAQNRGASVSGYGSARRYGRTGYVPRRNDDDDMEDAEYEIGEVGENETALQRFGKDAVAGGLRGAFYSMWQFWKRYRIP